ncbi:MAG: T9SS type A sorting domain-containing protein, partial [Bacteroidales bacterium]|nr:T9SS type A sorting domain-containing protein [Bacteroidales bacterium]
NGSALAITGNPTPVEFTDYEGNVFEPSILKSADNSNFADESELSVYPNPGDGIFNLRLENQIQGTFNIKVINALGGIVFEENGMMTDKALQKTINLTGLSNGVYILSIENNQQVIQKKVILNK